MTSRALLLTGLLLLPLGGCRSDAGGGAAAQEGPAPALSDSAFAALVESLSGPGGYFDTDNLVSNESSYLHVLGPIRERGVRGGAYIGVGPGQNFSYIAEVRPRIAFIVDIRRDNLLHHLLYKALFESAPTRIEFLALLTGRPVPAEPTRWEERDVVDLVAYVDTVSFDTAAARRARAVVDSAVATLGVPLRPGDTATIRGFHGTFIEEGTRLRFRSHGRAPRPYYPTLGRLLLERDLTGARGSYMADPDDYAFVRELQLRNLVIPLVGDLAGDHALRAVGEELRRRGERVTAIYASNVEFYLHQDGSFDAFAANVASLPRAPGAVILRSYFPRFRRPHPHNVPGYWSTQSLQTVESFVERSAEGGYDGYWDLLTRDALDPRSGGR